ncbi:MAG: hypothetical protein K2H13_08105 [Eubacterium sp.]|nr:hypothetical protein [Eubacterium sp.]MDE6154881.1 hypothetical protein [Eubacterium sp.]
MNDLNFISNERVIEQLGCLIDSKRFPHAVVIEGAQGLGKRTLARLLATALVCRGENKPCMDCTQCSKSVQKIHPDIFEHSAAGGANSFHVDVIRDVVKDAYVQPNEADYKVYILGNADCMSVSAQNALLKVLEEPPSYVVFILTAQSKSMLLETVLSRSVTVKLEGVDADKGAAYISSKLDDVSYEQAKQGLETFNGNIGKTIDSFADGKQNELARTCCDICRALVDDSEYSLLCACSIFQKDRGAIVFAADFLKNIFRDALVYNENSSFLSGQRETARLLKTKLTKQKLVDLINVCDTLKEMALMNSNNSILITKICYSLRQAVGR